MLLQDRVILFIRSSGSTRRRPYQALKNQGARLIVYEKTAHSWFGNLFEQVLTGPVSNCDETVDFILNLLQEKGISPDAVMTFDDYGVILSSRIASRLHLACIPPEVMQVARSKLNLRRFCKERGLPHVQHWKVTDDGDCLADILPHLHFPVVFKPCEGAGSNLVQKIHNETELQHAVKHAVTKLQLPEHNFEWASKNGANNFMIEEFVQGHEVDVDMIVQHNKIMFISISDNFSARRPPFFMEQGGQCPSQLPTHHQEALRDLAQSLMGELASLAAGLGSSTINGCFHFEVMVTEANGPVPIELNCRLGGAESYSLVKSTYNVDLGVAAGLVYCNIPITCCTGEYTNTSNNSNNGTNKSNDDDDDYNETLLNHQTLLHPVHNASINFVPESTCILRKQYIPEAVRSDPYFYDVELYWEVGTLLELPPDGFKYLGWMVATGETPEAANNNVIRLTKMIEFDLESAANKTVRVTLSENDRTLHTEDDVNSSSLSSSRNSVGNSNNDDGVCTRTCACLNCCCYCQCTKCNNTRCESISCQCASSNCCGQAERIATPSSCNCAA